jgi:X-Pro dipeptidyl-peptidase
VLRRVGVTVLLASGLVLGLLAPASAEGQAEPDLDAIDPIRFDYDDAIVEFSQVTSRNGVDQIWVDIIRPDTDEPVPTILIASPYYNTLGRGWRGELKSPHQGPAIPTSPGFPALGGTSHTPFPEWYDEYFVPRGYAVALMDLRGTRNSSGCQEYGDRKEVFDAVDVIDSIADQPWSNGKVGMTGGSYDGTIAIGAAVEQPMSGRHRDALAAIIPIRAIGRWYDYHFFNGAQSSSHFLTPALFTTALPAGDTQNAGTDDTLLPVHVVERKACMATFGQAVNAGHASPYQDARAAFWRQRDFTRSASGIRAATFIIHGIFDYNVKTNNIGYLWEDLPSELPKKLWLCNCAHTDPHTPTASNAHPFPFQEMFVEATHRWFAQFLKTRESGALEGPNVEVQGVDGAWADGGPQFPAARDDLVLSLTADGRATTGEADEGSVTFRDGPASDAPSTVTFVSDPLPTQTRVSGQFAFDLDVSAEGPDATIAVTVLDVPPGVSPTDDPTTTMTPTRTQPLIISYAWLRAWYRDTVPLRGISTPTGGAPLDPGEEFDARFGSLYTDLVIPAGHRLAFRFSASAGGTFASNLADTIAVHTGQDRSTVLVPVVSTGDACTQPGNPPDGRGRCFIPSGEPR